MKQARQGDVFIRRLAKPEIPTLKDKIDVDPNTGEIVLAYGERSNHVHALENPDAGFLSTIVNPTYGADGDDQRARHGGDLNARLPMQMVLTVTQPTRLIHHSQGAPEPGYVPHEPIPLGPGIYEIRRQREQVGGFALPRVD